MLKGVWGAAGYPWSVRLKALIPLWMPWVREHFHLRPEVERQLLAISARQIDRRLRPYKSLRPATPVRRHPTGSPAEASHPPEGGSLGCPRSRLHGSGSGGAVGQLGGGEFAYTLNVTDVYSGWTESRAVVGQGSRHRRCLVSNRASSCVSRSG